MHLVLCLSPGHTDRFGASNRRRTACTCEPGESGTFFGFWEDKMAQMITPWTATAIRVATGCPFLAPISLFLFSFSLGHALAAAWARRPGRHTRAHYGPNRVGRKLLICYAHRFINLSPLPSSTQTASSRFRSALH